MWDYIIIVNKCYNSYVGRRPYLWVYEWGDNPASNVLDLCPDVCLLSLNHMQSFKFVCMTFDLLMDTSTRKCFPRTYPTAGQFLLIILQLK